MAGDNSGSGGGARGPAWGEAVGGICGGVGRGEHRKWRGAAASGASTTGVHGSGGDSSTGWIAVDAERESGPEGVASAGVCLNGRVSSGADAGGRDALLPPCGGFGAGAGGDSR